MVWGTNLTGKFVFKDGIDPPFAEAKRPLLIEHPILQEHELLPPPHNEQNDVVFRGKNLSLRGVQTSETITALRRQVACEPCRGDQILPTGEPLTNRPNI